MNNRILEYRRDFPLLFGADIAYLDNAATTQKPLSVLDAVRHYYEAENANPLRGVYELSEKATAAYENAREAVKNFICAKSSDEIIFTPNASASINLVAYSYGLSKRHGTPQQFPAMEDGCRKDRRKACKIVPWRGRIYHAGSA